MTTPGDDGAGNTKLVITKARALLITRAGGLLLIRRHPPNDAVWWVLPGGGVEPGDASLEDAACREVSEETGGNLEIHSLVQVVTTNCHQAIFLGRISSADAALRSGPELSDGSGEYHLDEQPLDADALEGLDLWPPPTKDWLVDMLRAGTDLFSLPDLRTGPPFVWAAEPEHTAAVRVMP